MTGPTEEFQTRICDGAYGPIEGAVQDQVVFGHYEKHGTWSPSLIHTLAGLLGSSGGTLLDMGANLGLVSVAVAQRCGCQCLAFEPEPRNCELLRRNLARHALQDRVEVFELALSDRAEPLHLSLSPDNFGDHRLDPASADTARTHLEVPARPLDEVLEDLELGGPLVVKLDTQGAEVRVLRGARHSLPRVDHLVVEYWPAGLRRMGDDPDELHQLLDGFAAGALMDDSGVRLPLMDPARLFDSLAWIARDGSDQGFFDLLLTRHPDQVRDVVAQTRLTHT